MPHNLFLHSSLVLTRHIDGRDVAAVCSAIRYSIIDTVISLFCALFVNASILVVAAGRLVFIVIVDIAIDVIAFLCSTLLLLMIIVAAGRLRLPHRCHCCHRHCNCCHCLVLSCTSMLLLMIIVAFSTVMILLPLLLLLLYSHFQQGWLH